MVDRYTPSWGHHNIRRGTHAFAQHDDFDICLSFEEPLYPLPEPETWSDVIRIRRIEVGLKQKDLAASIGADEMSIVNWERGYRFPKKSKLEALAKGLGIAVFDITSRR